jgi:carbamoyl-phosphate synthase large subunit
VFPTSGRAFISVRDPDKEGAIAVATRLVAQGFTLCATRGTHKVLTGAGLTCKRVNKVLEGRPHIVDMVKNGDIDLIINTTEGKQAIADSSLIRRSALVNKVSYTTTLAGAEAICQALAFGEERTVRRLQDVHEGMMQ